MQKSVKLGKTRINFVEQGFGNRITAIGSDAGIPLAETQGKLTPIQRIVITKTLEKQQDEAESQSQEPRRNPRSSGSGNSVTYVNEG